jgi:hypothetical protein
VSALDLLIATVIVWTVGIGILVVATAKPRPPLRDVTLWWGASAVMGFVGGSLRWGLDGGLLLLSGFLAVIGVIRSFYARD